MNVLERIQARLSGLSKAEKAVAELVLKDPVAFMRVPVSEAAALAKVSSPTVVRFCRSLGYEGLSDFKLKLASGLSKGSAYVHQNVTVRDSTDEVLKKVFDNAISTLEGFKTRAPMGAIEDAAKLMARSVRKKGRLIFFGAGNSGVVARDAEHKFFRLGCHASSFSDGHLQVMQASMLTPNDVLFIWSNSGRGRDLIDTTKIAKSNGCPVLLVSQTGAPLSKLVDIFIAADHVEGYEQYSPMVSRLLHLCILDVLVTKVALGLGEKAQKQQAVLKENLIQTRYAR